MPDQKSAIADALLKAGKRILSDVAREGLGSVLREGQEVLKRGVEELSRAASAVDPAPGVCKVCKGRKWVEREERTVECPSCKGTGNETVDQGESK